MGVDVGRTSTDLPAGQVAERLNALFRLGPRHGTGPVGEKEVSKATGVPVYDIQRIRAGGARLADTRPDFVGRLNYLFATRPNPDATRRNPGDKKPLYSKRHVAGKIKCTPAYMSKLCAGKIHKPGWDKVEALAAFFDVTVDYFLDSPLQALARFFGFPCAPGLTAFLEGTAPALQATESGISGKFARGLANLFAYSYPRTRGRPYEVEDVAAATGISCDMIEAFRDGRLGPTLSQAVRLAAFFDAPLDALCSDEGVEALVADLKEIDAERKLRVPVYGRSAGGPTNVQHVIDKQLSRYRNRASR